MVTTTLFFRTSTPPSLRFAESSPTPPSKMGGSTVNPEPTTTQAVVQVLLPSLPAHAPYTLPSGVFADRQAPATRLSSPRSTMPKPRSATSLALAAMNPALSLSPACSKTIWSSPRNRRMTTFSILGSGELGQ